MPYQKELELFANRRPTVVERVPELAPRKHFTRGEVFGNPELPTSITVVTVGGKSYTGKTGFAESFGKKMRLKQNRIFLVGKFMREAKQAGQIAQGTMPEDRELDKASDALQSDIAHEATTQNPALLESRLAALLAKDLNEKYPELGINSVSILLLATEETRKQRALQRTTRDINRNITRITKELHELEKEGADRVLINGATLRIGAQHQALADLDIDELWTEEIRREREDEEEYRGLYPWLGKYQQGYMEPGLTDETGKTVYDIIFDTSGYTPEQVHDMICEEIIKFRQEREDIETIVHALDRPEEAVVFEESARTQSNQNLI
jgi:cytidylate kinase